MTTTQTQDATHEIIDVSHAIGAGTETYPGLPAPRLEVLIDYEASSARYGVTPAHTWMRRSIATAAVQISRRCRSSVSRTCLWC